MPPLDDEEIRVILGSGTEAPWSGRYEGHSSPGLYVCRQCGAPLYRHEDKFETACGWAGFDDSIGDSVAGRPDPNPEHPWTEILCANCHGHLGHLFQGEGYTPKNTRHCVNSVSLAHIGTQTAFVGSCSARDLGKFMAGVKGVALTQEAPGAGLKAMPRAVVSRASSVAVATNSAGGSGEEGALDRGPSTAGAKKNGGIEMTRIDFDPTAIDYGSVIRLCCERLIAQTPGARATIFCQGIEQWRAVLDLAQYLQEKGLPLDVEFFRPEDDK
ncbi:MAG: peptide-methionine (R)-S-oxide reductase [Deltaproteobacteria bacterium]|jgi:peptide methionine sulfoxide reductase msrA/msrB|nr:peptide-methionine (R)-S-oxide reductase [Deltaproteobacteria bacterium]